MINLCLPVSHDYTQFNIDDVDWIVSHKDEFIIPFVAKREEYQWPTISIQLCDWEVYKDDTYISISMLINLDNIDEFSLRVNEGYYCNTNERIIDGDGFLDIKTDNWSIRQAISDIKEKQLPLHNRVQNIKAEDYPYMMEDEEQDEDY
jgi:hypothetical protein